MIWAILVVYLFTSLILLLKWYPYCVGLAYWGGEGPHPLQGKWLRIWMVALGLSFGWPLTVIKYILWKIGRIIKNWDHI